MLKASQTTVRVEFLFMVGSGAAVGVLLQGDYSSAVFDMPVYERGESSAAFTLAEGTGLTATLKANVYYNADTGDVRYTSATGYADLGQYTEVLVDPSSGQRTTLAVKHDYELRADGEPLVSGLISAKRFGNKAGECVCQSLTDYSVLVAPV